MHFLNLQKLIFVNTADSFFSQLLLAPAVMKTHAFTYSFVVFLHIFLPRSYAIILIKTLMPNDETDPVSRQFHWWISKKCHRWLPATFKISKLGCQMTVNAHFAYYSHFFCSVLLSGDQFTRNNTGPCLEMNCLTL